MKTPDSQKLRAKMRLYQQPRATGGSSSGDPDDFSTSESRDTLSGHGYSSAEKSGEADSSCGRSGSRSVWRENQEEPGSSLRSGHHRQRAQIDPTRRCVYEEVLTQFLLTLIF